VKAHTPNRDGHIPLISFVLKTTRDHTKMSLPVTRLKRLQYVLAMRSINNQVYREYHNREMLRPQVRRQTSQRAIITLCNHSPQDNPATACDWTGRRFGLSDTKSSVSSNLQLRLVGGAHAVTPGRDRRLGQSKQRRACSLLVC
jgi:hypothetical protein